jgi:8-oxo-dGTP pyrophosphatase MutT (NUDIX family)
MSINPMPERPESRPVRLVVAAETSSAIDRASVEVSYLAGSKVTKADLTDALIRVGLTRLEEVAAHLRGGNPERMTAEARRPEPLPVVAGIVTSALGVLVGQRNDGKPPWTFIAGEIEPGESPADAVVREVAEETGLRVMAAEREIGRRVHPKTGRTMIYLACSPTGRTDVIVGDPEELAQVRWVSLTEAVELLPGLFEPVHQYLISHLAEIPKEGTPQ